MLENNNCLLWIVMILHLQGQQFSVSCFHSCTCVIPCYWVDWACKKNWCFSQKQIPYLVLIISPFLIIQIVKNLRWKTKYERGQWFIIIFKEMVFFPHDGKAANVESVSMLKITIIWSIYVLLRTNLVFVWSNLNKFTFGKYWQTITLDMVIRTACVWMSIAG